MHLSFQRTLFETPRASEYFNVADLQALTGQPVTGFAAVGLKELVDNAIDACESAGVAPQIGIFAYTVDGVLMLSVTDNGAGIPPETVRRALNFSTRTSDKRGYRAPTRGIQGNALKTIFGMPAALGLPEAPIMITAQGVRHGIRAWLDPAGSVRVEHNDRPVPFPHIGKLQLAKLTPDHVQRLLNEAANEGLSPHSVSNVRGALRRALNQALRFGYITRNVATLVDAPRTTTFTIQTLDEEQARQLLAAVAGHRLEALYRVALALGLRRGEICGLLWSDVDFENARIKITGMLQRQNGKLERTPTKTKASAATLALPPVLLRALRQHKERQDQERADAEDWEETGYVFASECGTPLEPRNLNRHFKSVLKKLGLPDTIRFHDLRHSCASLLIAQGEDLTVVKDILRHSQISVTADYYVHIVEKTQRRAIEGLDTLLSDDAVLELPPRKVRKEEK